jgi:tetratricopeptide (TPR) repeat protein
MMRTIEKTIWALLCINAALFLQTASAQAPSTSATLPMTSQSDEARQLVQQALTLYLDRVQQEPANEILRKAIKIDPNFAMAHELLAQISLNSSEQVSEQKAAFATRKHATPSEQTVIEWYQDAADHKLLAAIPEMNEVIRQYPHDKWVVWMTTWWLMSQSQFERALDVYEQSGIKDSPGLLNNMGYDCADLRQFDKAFVYMDQYVASMPGDPNPLDSYAEILRLAGRYDPSIQHYRAALAIDPTFYSSQFGIADTYSLMGDQARARREYEIGFARFEVPELQQVLWKTRRASTYVREGDYAGADKAFQEIADYAHSRQISQVEADTYRQMAEYQQDPKQAVVFLNKADAALSEGNNAQKIALQQEEAQVLRARVELALKTEDAATAKSNLLRLSKLAANSGDKLIDLAYSGAEGAVLFSHEHYQDAISRLEEDITDPRSLKLLIAAYQNTGDSAGAKQTSELLANLNDPTTEQAMVVPEFKKCMQTSSCGGDLRPVSLPHSKAQAQ